MPYHHEIRVRYGEVDMQGVVFNAHYLSYVDDAMTHWLHGLGYPFDDMGWDFMVRAATLDWRGSGTAEDTLQIECDVLKWGTTSFTVGYDVHVEDRHLVHVEVTYVGVKPRTTEKMPIPDAFREYLSREAAPSS